MRKSDLRYLNVVLWGLLALLVFWVSGCSVESDALRARGPFTVDAGVDRGTAPDLGSSDAVPGTDSVAAEAPRAALDSSPPDAVPVVEVRPPFLDTGTAPDLRPAVDVLPVECTKLGPWTHDYAFLIQLPSTSYCFTVCPDSTAPIDFGWTCLGFTAKDRNLAVNGKAVECGTKGEMPATVNGGWTFTLDPGGTGTYVQWNGALKACP